MGRESFENRNSSLFLEIYKSLESTVANLENLHYMKEELKNETNIEIVGKCEELMDKYKSIFETRLANLFGEKVEVQSVKRSQKDLLEVYSNLLLEEFRQKLK
jgi:CTP synthase (UTP-ammonia lyase)